MFEKLRDLIDHKFIIVAIISAITIEYFMVMNEAMVDFPSIVASIQLYLLITIVMAIVYHTIWGVEYLRILNIIGRSMLFILPIGIFWAYYDGYTNETLMNIEWLFTHDMI